MRDVVGALTRRWNRRHGSGAEVADTPSNHWATVNTAYRRLRDRGLAARPNYTWSMLHVGNIARHLGIDRLSAIEFGVAGGNGLVALDQVAGAVRDALGIHVDVHGFDTGAGLPPPRDHRDAPFIMSGGDFPMDEARLRSRLSGAELHLGLVEDTLPAFLERQPAPVAFVSVDVDFYSSAVAALKLFDAPARLLFPRVLCYFDDVLGYPWGDFNGERLALSEFNASHSERKIAYLHGFKFVLPTEEFHTRWAETMYLTHIFDHPRYGDDEGTEITRRLDLS